MVAREVNPPSPAWDGVLEVGGKGAPEYVPSRPNTYQAMPHSAQVLRGRLGEAPFCVFLVWPVGGYTHQTKGDNKRKQTELCEQHT